MFKRYGFQKLNFTVTVGNPIEKTYDKLVNRYGGRVVGVRRMDVKLMDGKLYDVKEYEILASDYFNKENIYKNSLKRGFLFSPI